MLKVRRFKATGTGTIEDALADLPEGSFRQLVVLPNSNSYQESYMVVFELTEEQAKNWTEDDTAANTTRPKFKDY